MPGFQLISILINYKSDILNYIIICNNNIIQNVWFTTILLIYNKI